MLHRSVTLLPLLLLTAVTGACSLTRRDDAPPPGTATVVHVIDGDTVDLLIGRQAETARLLGIDTPETVKPGAPVDCFGPEASARTKHLLPPGTVVRLTRDVEVRDRFDRLLVYVVRAEDDLFVNRDLVAGGYARTLPIAPNDAHRADLAAAEAEARSGRRGLWDRCAPEGR